MLINKKAIPNNEYYEYYGPDYELDVRPSNMTDLNTPAYLDKLKEAVFEILRDKDAAPSVPLQAVPRLAHDDESDDEMEDEEDKDERRNRAWTFLSRMFEGQEVLDRPGLNLSRTFTGQIQATRWRAIRLRGRRDRRKETSTKPRRDQRQIVQVEIASAQITASWQRLDIGCAKRFSRGRR